MTQLAELLDTRHPSVKSVAKWLQVNPNLPEGDAKYVAGLCEALAATVLRRVDEDSPELSAGLRKLLEAKDCFVRAAIGGNE